MIISKNINDLWIFFQSETFFMHLYYNFYVFLFKSVSSLKNDLKIPEKYEKNH